MVVHNKKYIRISIVLPLHKWDCKLLNKNGYKFCYAMLDIKDRKSTRLNSSHMPKSRMPSSA